MVLYRVFPFKYYIHESFHSHSCMNSCYSFMCSYMVLWLLLSLDMIGIFHISYYGFIPMLYQRLHVVINHRYFFFLVLVLLVGYRVDLCVCVGWPNFSFYHIEVKREECMSEIKNGPLEKTIKIHCHDYHQSTTTIKRYLYTTNSMYHWRLEELLQVK